MIGYHIYNQTKQNKQFEEIDYLTQLTSILYWKKYYGEIKLYCNNMFLQSIKKYGLDKEYSEINTHLFENSPYKKYAEVFWSFSKIYAIADIAKKEQAFCAIDTDLWIAKPNMLRSDIDILFYHKEYADTLAQQTAYPDATNWLESNIASQFNWKISPRNGAIMCFNSNFKDIVQVWQDMCITVMENTNITDLAHLNKDSHTIFIEQRLLPTLATKLEATISQVLPNTFIPYSYEEWRPCLGHTQQSDYVASNIKHIWGAKKAYLHPPTRKLVLDVLLPAALQVITDQPHHLALVQKCKSYL